MSAADVLIPMVPDGSTVWFEGLQERSTFENGPVVCWWGRDTIVPREDGPERTFDGRRKTFLAWIFGLDLWIFEIRLAPPAGADLHKHGKQIAEAVGWEIAAPKDGHRATWLAGTFFAKDGALALGRAGTALRQLEGIDCGEIQITVRKWTEADAPMASTGTARQKPEASPK